MSEEIATTKVDMSHHIQRHIVLSLRQYGALSYQTLKPDGIEGNAYNYHLRLLKKAGLIVVKESHYELSPTGFLVADAYSSTTKRLMLRPHMYTMLCVTSGDKVLLYEATRAPLKGYISFPSGKLHFGDSITQSIAREMTRRELSSEYTAATISPVNIRYLVNDDVVVHRPGTVWHISYDGPLTETRTESGVVRWVTVRDVKNLPCLPEVNEGLKRLTADSHEPIDLEWPLGK